MAGLYSLHSRQNRYSRQNINISNQANWLTTQNYACNQYGYGLDTGSLIMGGTGLFYNWLRNDHSSEVGGGGSSKSKKASEDDKAKEQTEKQINEQNDQLRNCLKEVGCDSYAGLENKINKQGNTVQAAKKAAEEADEGVKTAQGKIDALNLQKPKPNDYDKQMETLNSELETAKIAQSKKAEELQTANAELQRLNEAKTKADEIKQKIEELENSAEGASPEEKRDVGKEGKSMSAYNYASLEFESSPTQDNLNKLLSEYSSLKDSCENVSSFTTQLNKLQEKYKNLDWSKANL